MSNDEDYILDISSFGSSNPSPKPTGQPAGGNSPDQNTGSQNDAEIDDSGSRPWISVFFECCQVYQRIYRNQAGTAYVGWCPKCMRKITAEIGPDGTATRFFRAK